MSTTEAENKKQARKTDEQKLAERLAAHKAEAAEIAELTKAVKEKKVTRLVKLATSSGVLDLDEEILKKAFDDLAARHTGKAPRAQ